MDYFQKFIFFAILLFLSEAVLAESDQELAQKLTNPVANLISVPFQFNYDHDIGPEETGHSTYLKIQPVIPISLNANWNLISRTILPIISQTEVFRGAGSQFGLGDTLQTFFISPKLATASGIFWGLGPAISIPTATNQTFLGSGKWSIGPSPVVLKISGPWTYGILANQLWSVAGNHSRDEVNQLYLQPFLAYTTKDAWTYTLNSESYYYWNEHEWSAPFNFFVSKLVRIGKQPVNIGGGIRYWASSTDADAHHFGARFIVTLLFPE